MQFEHKSDLQASRMWWFPESCSRTLKTTLAFKTLLWRCRASATDWVHSSTPWQALVPSPLPQSSMMGAPATDWVHSSTPWQALVPSPLPQSSMMGAPATDWVHSSTSHQVLVHSQSSMMDASRMIRKCLHHCHLIMEEPTSHPTFTRLEIC